MRRLLIVAAVAAALGAATLLWLKLRPRPEPPQLMAFKAYENVLAALVDGELVRTTAALDAGTPRGQAQTVEVDRRDGPRAVGLLSRADGTPPYAWLVGSKPSFVLDVVQPVDRELLIELANGAGGPQSVEVLFNGTSVVRQELNLDPENVFSVLAPVPAALQRRGSNRVDLRFSRTEMKALQNEPALPLAAVLEHVAFMPPGHTRDQLPPPPPAGLVERVVEGQRRNALVLPPDTVARAPLRLPAAPRIVLRFLLQELHAPLEVSLQVDEGRMPLHVFEPGGGAPTAAEFDLTPWAGKPVVLEFLARGARDDGALAARLADANVLVPADWIEPQRVATPGPPAGSRPSFLVVVLDAFARRYQSAVLNGNIVTPAMDGVADHALVFEDATSPASYTLASIGSLLTGQFPLTHGVIAGERAGVTSRLAPEAPRLAAELQSRGWRTAAFITNPNASAAHGYGEGFELYDELSKDEKLWLPQGGVSGELLPARLAAYLKTVEGQPFFAYVHVFEPHAPYDAPPDLTARFVKPYQGPVNGSRAWIDAFRAGTVTTDDAGWTHLRELYAARAALADRVLARLLIALVKSGRDADTVLVVLSDHGESLGEHGELEHGDAVPREQLDIPLLMAVPGLGKGRRKGPASVADVAPTLLRLAGITPPDSMQGIDLLGGALDVHRPLPANSSVYLPQLSWARDGHRLVVDLLTRRVRLYDESVDPGDTRDLSDERPAMRQLLLRELCSAVSEAETARAAQPPPPAGTPMSPAQAQQLGSIGYMQGAQAGGNNPLRLTAALRSLLVRL